MIQQNTISKHRAIYVGSLVNRSLASYSHTATQVM